VVHCRCPPSLQVYTSDRWNATKTPNHGPTLHTHCGVVAHRPHSPWAHLAQAGVLQHVSGSHPHGGQQGVDGLGGGNGAAGV
jgi:hypothetical protein